MVLSLYACLCFFSYKDTSLIGLRLTLIHYNLIFTWLHLGRPYFQIRSPSQYWGLRLQHIFLKDIIQFITHSSLDVFYFFSCLITLSRTPVQCWIKVGESIQSFTIKFDVRCDFFHRYPFSNWKSSILFLVCVSVLSWKSVGICHMLFLHLLRWSCNCLLLYWYDVLHWLNFGC